MDNYIFMDDIDDYAAEAAFEGFEDMRHKSNDRKARLRAAWNEAELTPKIKKNNNTLKKR